MSVFVHMVSFKFRDDASAEDKAAFATALDALTSIPGVLRVSHGANVADRSTDWNYGLLVEFVDQAAERAYQPHPTHQVVVAAFKKIGRTGDDVMGSVHAVDFYAPKPAQ